jgi:hypothetical protein
MAIDMRCPHCAKAYRLKDEMAGKRVQCANQACRKPFQVAAAGANGTATATATPPPTKPVAPAAKPAAKPPLPAELAAKPKPPLPADMAPPKPPAPPVDADALALAALKDEPEQAGPADARVVHMTCAICEHKWDVPWAMQGKNVLCPECRHRQKVPEQKDRKKADWRDGSGRPSLARQEELEGVTSNRDARMISGQTARDAGLVQIEYEPRPLSFWVKVVGGPVALVALIAAFVVYKIGANRESFGRERFDKLIAGSADDLKQVPLYQALLLTAAAEYEARLGVPEERKVTSSRDKAVRDLQEALEAAKAAPPTDDRGFLFGEIALAALHLGGDGEALKEKTKLSWLPPPANPQGKAQVKPNPAELGGVQGQLQRVFGAMLDKQVEFEVKAWAARRVARELLRLKQPELAETFAQGGFTDAERFEADAQIGVECLRAGDATTARRIADRLAAALVNPSAANPPAASAQALFLALDPPITKPTVAPPPGGEALTDATRLAYTVLNVLKKTPDEALKIANAPGEAAGRLRALALAAEWADAPGPFLDTAAKLVGSGQVPAAVGVRLAALAGRAGSEETAEAFVKAITDEPARAWAKAEVLRGRLAAGAAVPEDAAGDMPDDPKKMRAGQALARLAVARSTAAKTGDAALAKKYGGWPRPFAVFGQAGVALGLLDR